MTDLNRYLVEELNAAHEGGRDVAYHMSPSLLDAMHQVQSHGTIANSFQDGWDFLEFVDTVGIQFHAFNTSKIAAIDMQEYNALDPSQKVVFTAIMDEAIGEDTLIVHQNGRYLVGPVRAFQYYDPITGANAVQPGAHSIIPDFQLPAGQTWVQLSLPSTDDQTSAQPEDAASTDESDSALALEQERGKNPPRPPNPFIIYRSERHKTVAAMHPELSNNEISKRLGRQWQAEKDEVRDLYRAKAAQIKDAFMQAHPDYKYQPRKSCNLKRRAKKSNEPQSVKQEQTTKIQSS